MAPDDSSDPPPAPPALRTERPPQVGSTRVTIAAVAVTGVAMFPVWLVGALAPDIQRDLGFGPAALGAAVAAFQAVSAVCSVPAGLFAERYGWRTGSLGAVGMFIVAMSGMALFATDWTSLTVWLAVAAVGSALSSPTVNLGLVQLVDPARQGVAFGIKQAAVPAGTIAAGLAVPAIALTIGWRWAFGFGAIGAVPLALTIPRRVGSRPARSSRLGSRPEMLPPLLLLATGAGLGTAATNSIAAFFVLSAVEGGIATATAGLTLAAGGAISVVARVVAGWRADLRGRRHLVVVAAMMAAGSFGVAGFSATTTPTALFAVTMVAYGLGWSWNGLFDFALVRHMSATPATATGVAQTAKYLGGVAGPFAFGITVESFGFDVAWAAAAGVLMLAAVTVLAGRSLLRTAVAQSS